MSDMTIYISITTGIIGIVTAIVGVTTYVLSSRWSTKLLEQQVRTSDKSLGDRIASSDRLLGEKIMDLSRSIEKLGAVLQSMNSTINEHHTRLTLLEQNVKHQGGHPS